MRHVLDAAFKGLLDAILSHRGVLNKTHVSEVVNSLRGHPQTFGTVVHLHVLEIACLAEGRRLVGRMSILALAKTIEAMIRKAHARAVHKVLRCSNATTARISN